MNFKKLSIIIPAYNEGATIHLILDKVKTVDLVGGIEKDIIIVCSGAIALGSPLIKNKNLRKLEDKQAAASVGQIELAHQWKQHLKTHKINIAQVLITLEDSEVRRRYLNARKTINTLLFLRSLSKFTPTVLLILLTDSIII